MQVGVRHTLVGAGHSAGPLAQYAASLWASPVALSTELSLASVPESWASDGATLTSLASLPVVPPLPALPSSLGPPSVSTLTSGATPLSVPTPAAPLVPL